MRPPNVTQRAPGVTHHQLRAGPEPQPCPKPPRSQTSPPPKATSPCPVPGCPPRSLVSTVPNLWAQTHPTRATPTRANQQPMAAYGHHARVTLAVFSPAPRSSKRGHPALWLYGGRPLPSPPPPLGDPTPGAALPATLTTALSAGSSTESWLFRFFCSCRGRFQGRVSPGGHGERLPERSLRYDRSLRHDLSLRHDRSLRVSSSEDDMAPARAAACGRSEHRVTTGQRPLPPSAGAGGQRKDRSTTATSPPCRRPHALPPREIGPPAAPERCLSFPAAGKPLPREWGRQRSHPSAQNPQWHPRHRLGATKHSAASGLHFFVLGASRSHQTRAALCTWVFSHRVGAALKTPLIVSGENGRAP